MILNPKHKKRGNPSVDDILNSGLRFRQKYLFLKANEYNDEAKKFQKERTEMSILMRRKKKETT